MGRSQADVAVTALIAVLACATAAAGAPVAVTAVTGIALFAAPGYLLGELLMGSRTAGLERLAVCAGLALAVPVLGGLLLHAVGVPLHRPGWFGLLACVTLACDAALFARRRAADSGRAAGPGPAAAGSGPAAAGSGPAALTSGRTGRRWPRWPAAVFAAAVLVAACGVGLARIGAARQQQPGFTQLWLAPQRHQARTLSLGVSNDEGKTASYRLVLLRDGQISASWDLTLGDRQTWQRAVPFTGRDTLTADLYRLPDVSHPYRSVSTGT